MSILKNNMNEALHQGLHLYLKISGILNIRGGHGTLICVSLDLKQPGYGNYISFNPFHYREKIIKITLI